MSSDDIEIAQYLIVRFGPPTFLKLSYTLDTANLLYFFLKYKTNMKNRWIYGKYVQVKTIICTVRNLKYIRTLYNIYHVHP